MGKNVVFIDSVQFMNFRLRKLVKNLSEKDFKYIVQFGSENLELLKQKGSYPYEYISILEKVEEKKLPTRKYFFSSKEKLVMMIKNQTITEVLKII